MESKMFETLVGAGVILAAVLFTFYAYSRTDAAGVSGYDVVARFNRVDGISVGSDVLLSGIKVGTVSKMSLDPKNFLAVTRLTIADTVKLPDDSAIKITTSGLLSNSYLSIEPGGSDKNIPPGGEIQNTQGSIDLMGLIGKFMFSSSESEKAPASNATQPAPANATQPVPQDHP